MIPDSNRIASRLPITRELEISDHLRPFSHQLSQLKGWSATPSRSGWRGFRYMKKISRHQSCRPCLFEKSGAGAGSKMTVDDSCRFTRSPNAIAVSP